MHHAAMNDDADADKYEFADYFSLFSAFSEDL